MTAKLPDVIVAPGLRLVGSVVVIAVGVVALPSPTQASRPEPAIELFASGSVPDYQLGGAYDPPDGVGIVARDRTAEPADGVYSICYVNAFQTQPGELGEWPSDVLLLDDSGDPVTDPDWPDEVLLDTSTPQRVAGIAEIVGPWIAGCAEAGFDAVEFDNLDTYTRTPQLTRDGNVALARELVEIAHESGLAAGQKNAAEDAALFRSEAGFDFAVVEECHRYDECAAYTEVYGDHVVIIEYADDGYDADEFAAACEELGDDVSMVLRDRDLVRPDEPGYVFAGC